MFKNNSTVKVSGKAGHNVDLDEYVETYIVRPLKTYATGHTSVQMCQRLMGNLDILGSTRNAYASRQAFNIHPTTKHTEQSSFPDQVKDLLLLVLKQQQMLSDDHLQHGHSHSAPPKSPSVE
ncbi:Hypothetical predicted protein [Paramuricea clavata]|uniref:Uncharacterized protein n=1 Tax=Paramuricea clavata TaxID=317549 RepID=A0A7D9EMS6_PARCT|nr:Hypothetical predicted protein [Paramuricea clavata]